MYKKEPKEHSCVQTMNEKHKSNSYKKPEVPILDTDKKSHDSRSTSLSSMLYGIIIFLPHELERPGGPINTKRTRRLRYGNGNV